MKRELIRIIAAAVLLVVSWLLPLSGAERLIVFLIPYLLVGYDILVGAIKNIFRGRFFDEKFLMSIATLGAFALGEYPEAVAVMLFYQIGEMFQDMAVDRSRRSISSLMDIRPDFAVVLRNGEQVKISPEDVLIGETILISPGEKIPLDGEIMDGETSVDASSLTGESLPMDKHPGDKVVSGSVNLNGVIRVKVQNSFEQSTVSKILDLVENSSARKAHAESFITRFAKYYTPCVIVGAVLLALIPPILFAAEWGVWLNRALVFLVVSCPCALVVSVPLSFFGGIGRASRHGILIKGANYLEALSKVRTVVFDKTGTLTKGSFFVAAVHPNIVSEDKLLDIAAAAESYSSHPVAQSIARGYRGRIDKSRVGRITELAGFGIKAEVDGKRVYVGNDKLMDKVGVRWRECHKAGTIIHICADGEYLGHIVISDEIKPDAAETISGLKALGVSKTVMLTGDTKSVGEAVGKKLGMDRIDTGLLPKDKVDALKAMQNEGEPLAFVGDGINDAPVLSLSDVGIAMGALGSDAAIEAADVVIMDDKPSKIVKAINISRRTMGIARQNIVLSLLVKGSVLALGALGIADIWFAVFADVGVMVVAVINAMRALQPVKNML